MNMVRFLIVATFLACAASASGKDVPSAYTLEHTEVRPIRAQALARDYQLFVALPDSYRAGKGRYPVVFVTDANYAFAVARNIAQRLHKHAGLEEVIVVGLSYAQGNTANYSRRRDYTPSVPRKSDYQSDMPQRQPAFGEASAYAKFISNDVFPFIARHYRADMGRRIFVGHSYGSLLGLQVLLTTPRTFDHYILGSPSLWFDSGIMFDREKAYAARNRDLPASVFFGIGGLERLPAGRKRNRSEEAADMVADLQEFDRALRAHRYPQLTMRMRVFDDEDHASVFPLVLTHGLRSYLRRAK